MQLLALFLLCHFPGSSPGPSLPLVNSPIAKVLSENGVCLPTWKILFYLENNFLGGLQTCLVQDVILALPPCSHAHLQTIRIPIPVHLRPSVLTHGPTPLILP